MGVWISADKGRGRKFRRLDTLILKTHGIDFYDLSLNFNKHTCLGSEVVNLLNARVQSWRATGALSMQLTFLSRTLQRVEDNGGIGRRSVPLMTTNCHFVGNSS